MYLEYSKGKAPGRSCDLCDNKLGRPPRDVYFYL
jgi:hypothetical protein